jgi:hypothetical protein
MEIAMYVGGILGTMLLVALIVWLAMSVIGAYLAVLIPQRATVIDKNNSVPNTRALERLYEPTTRQHWTVFRGLF